MENFMMLNWILHGFCAPQNCPLPAVSAFLGERIERVNHRSIIPTVDFDLSIITLSCRIPTLPLIFLFTYPLSVSINLTHFFLPHGPSFNLITGLIFTRQRGDLYYLDHRSFMIHSRASSMWLMTATSSPFEEESSGGTVCALVTAVVGRSTHFRQSLHTCACTSSGETSSAEANWTRDGYPSSHHPTSEHVEID